MGISKIAKQIILEELSENTHMEPVEDVIFWALKHYTQQGNFTMGEIVAYAIVSRIEEAERKHKETEPNQYDLIRKVLAGAIQQEIQGAHLDDATMMICDYLDEINEPATSEPFGQEDTRTKPTQ
jgi:hypothetical protein